MNNFSKKERACRAAIYEVDGVGPKKFEILINYFGSAEKIWQAPIRKVKETGLTKDAVEELETRRKKIEPVTHLKALAKLGIRVVLLEDEEYPDLLKKIDNHPKVLFVRGHFSLKDGKALAVVGTRKPTGYGREVASRLVNELVAEGFTIVSGLARGIDGIAHRTAIESGGRTIAILGGGVDRIYPPEHTGLAEKITQHGAVISEFASGKLPVPGNFPARNRVISGLSMGVLVIEGATHSGTKITASLAADQGREVFAVPGPITSRQSQAPTDLIKMGAKAVSSVSDILEELSVQSGPAPVEGQRQIDFNKLTKEEREIVEVLQDGQMQIDDLVRKIGKEASTISSTLTMLELKGIVKHLGGMVYAII
jgi:DNA processing protein